MGEGLSFPENGLREAEKKAAGPEREELVSEIFRTFSLDPIDPSQYSPLALAYIGDNVYELLNRTEMLSHGNRQAQKLHRDCAARANARFQAAAVRSILPELTAEEEAVYRRGRNAAVVTKAKNATIQQYHEATGFEAVIGYLYLQGKYARLSELVRRGFESGGEESRTMENPE